LNSTTSGAAEDDYSKASLEKLIDDLTLIEAQSLGLHSTANIYDAFIAEDQPLQFSVGVIGSPYPVVPPQMRELVRRGPQSLPALIRHLRDARPTMLKVGAGTEEASVGLGFLGGQYFSDEYDPKVRTQWRRRDRPRLEKVFSGSYTVRVADICYVLIGQIVNRPLQAIRYQPTAMMVVNSPLEAPTLITQVQRDWGRVGESGLRESLLSDLRGHFDVLYNPALARLRLYFPDTYDQFTGLDLKKRLAFESEERELQSQAQRPDQIVSRGSGGNLDRNMDGCSPLDVCLRLLDANVHDESIALFEGTAWVVDILQGFGDAAKQELLVRASGPDQMWRFVSGDLLGKWSSLGPNDLPMVMDAFGMQNGLAAAMALAKIGSPESMRALVEHFRIWGDGDIVAMALTSAGAKALPHLFPLLEDTDDLVWIPTVDVIRNMRANAAPEVDTWAAIATNTRNPRRQRLAAMRGLSGMVDNLPRVRELVAPLVRDRDPAIAQLAQQIASTP